MPGVQSAEVSHRTPSLTANTDGIVGGSRLLGQMRDLIRRKHDSIRTEQAYLGWARRHILFHGKRHPGDMGEAEIVAFLNHLAVKRTVAASTQNQALNALVFLYSKRYVGAFRISNSGAIRSSSAMARAVRTA